jgi:adenylate cyclase
VLIKTNVTITVDNQESSVDQAIMFADVSGSSALYKQQGNVAAKQLIDEAIALMCDITQGNRGTVVKTIGDEVMARFDTPGDACEAAVVIQQRCGLAVRIGINYGLTLLDDDDVFGDTVNDAAYVARIARSNQIVITQSLVNALSPRLQAYCQAFDRVNIKGEDGTSLIYRLVWENPAATQQATMVMTASHAVPKISTQELELSYGQQVFTVTPEDLPFIIGRDHRKCHLHVDSTLASRDHCHVVLRRGKFVLVDHSTNGTYVKAPDQPEIYLRREELPLIGEGTIAIGRRAQQGSELTIIYKL